MTTSLTFAMVLHELKSPQNVGMIVRSHVAFGGSSLVLIGPEPWRFRKGSQAFSRKLERLCDLVFLPDFDSFLGWSERGGWTPVALEISPASVALPQFVMPDRPALVLGNEGSGLPPSVLQRCASIVSIPQYGPTECLNVAVAASIAMYEFQRSQASTVPIIGDAYCSSNPCTLLAPHGHR